jgi:hypothetical protein
MQGLAADIHLDEVEERALFEYVAKLRLGGAGLYPRYDFVHVDVGPPRTWQEADAKERVLIGTENNPNPAWTVVTDKNSYRPGERIAIAVTNNDYGSQRFVKNLWIEQFRKGAWKEHVLVTKEGKAAKLEPGEKARLDWEIPADQPPGKYRLVLFANPNLSLPPASSNEFYVRPGGSGG